MDSIKRSVATVLTAISIISVVVGVLVFSTIAYSEYEKLAPFSYSPIAINANPFTICAGDNINYNVNLHIRDIGYEVLLYTSFYDRKTKQTITPVNLNSTVELTSENRILLAHPFQIMEAPTELQLTHVSPGWLTPGEYSMLRIASINGKRSQYYHVDFKIRECNR